MKDNELIMINFKPADAFTNMLTGFYQDHYNSLFHMFWENLSNIDERYRNRILEETLNIHENNTNSILYQRNEPKKTENIKDTFPDKSYYWVYDDYESIDKSNILHGTYEVQNKIWKHQNPMSCKDKKYIYIGDWPHGLGSTLMSYGLVMSYIFSMDRIMLWNPRGRFPYIQRGDFCKHNRTFNCIFHPLSNCTPEGKADIVYFRFNDIWPLMRKAVVPPFIHEILNKTSIHPSSYEWYWRVQAMTYIIRPLPNFLLFLKNKSKELSTNGDILNHMPISIYIRHGDKRWEMKLIEDKYYLSTLNIVFDFMHLDKKTPILLATQDQNSISFLKKSNINISFLNTSSLKYAKSAHFDNLILSLIEIWGMTRSKYIISTRRSNFDQVRLALQQTVGFKTDAFNFEVGQLRCLTGVHCKYLNTTLDFSTF